ncbi:MAG: NAD(+) diphosphatase [Dehalococcoidales bacterium]|nr:NAD(+) diphosphatase [Dehalococcoidales bacterium]
MLHRDSIYRRYERGFTPDSEDTGDSYWFLFSRGSMLVTPDGLHLPLLKNPEEAGISPVRKQYLGILDGKHCYSAELPPDVKAPDGMEFMNLMAVYSVLDEDIYLLAGKASQLVAWDQSHQFCGRCGNKTDYVPGERAKKCTVCGYMSFPRLSPAVITAVVKDKQLLLTQYATFRGNMRTIIAGFVEPGETVEECLHREVFEETGVRVKNPRYLGSQPWPFPNSLMMGFVAEYDSGDIQVDEKEIAHADWYDLADLPELPPELSIARRIIDWTVENYS